MNPAALRTNLNDLVPGGMLVVNTDAFLRGNLTKAGYDEQPAGGRQPRRTTASSPCRITDLTRKSLCKDLDLKVKDKDRCKNFFALGMMFYLYQRTLTDHRALDRGEVRQQADPGGGQQDRAQGRLCLLRCHRDISRSLQGRPCAIRQGHLPQ